MLSENGLDMVATVKRARVQCPPSIDLLGISMEEISLAEDIIEEAVSDWVIG